MSLKHKPDGKSRRIAEQMSGLGLPHEQIAAIIGIDDKTLRKYYQPELKIGKAKASSQVAKRLYDKALSGDTTACIWWTKAQMGWCEKVKSEISSADGTSLIPTRIELVTPDANGRKG